MKGLCFCNNIQGRGHDSNTHGGNACAILMCSHVYIMITKTNESSMLNEIPSELRNKNNMEPEMVFANLKVRI